FRTLGQYDAVAIVEAPHDVFMTAVGLGIGKLENVKQIACNYRSLLEKASPGTDRRTSLPGLRVVRELDVLIAVRGSNRSRTPSRELHRTVSSPAWPQSCRSQSTAAPTGPHDGLPHAYLPKEAIHGDQQSP